MYCRFFGFSEQPFNVTPDPKFLYLSPSHREALAALVYGIRERRGFIAIVGEVGLGKTTLLNTALDRLDENTRVGVIFNTDVTFDQTLSMGLVDLGLIQAGETVPKVEAVRRLNDFAIQQLSKGGNVVLLVDEAQNLDRSAMESLRLLSNLETRKHKLIQIVLSGQPELDLKLRQPEVRQLTQRISVKRYIRPLDEEETYEYIQHRLSVAEYRGPALFDRRAQQLIWEYSGGVPRKINVLCDNALQIAYALRRKTIKASAVEEAIKDLSWSPFSSSPETQERTPVHLSRRLRRKTSHSRVAIAASVVLAACLMFVGGLVLGASRLNWPGSGVLPAWTSLRSNAPLGLPRPEPWAAPETDELGTGGAGVVVVEYGDTLGRIILQTYGTSNRALIDAVLQENSRIQNPDLIRPGQVIKLPKRNSDRG